MNENFARYQTTAYKILDQDLKQNRISHAYLFTGPANAKKKEAAILFAQSLICQNKVNEWACEKCTVCQRIKAGEYLDVKIIDGSKSTIKKEEITKLLDYYSQTAMEKYGVKVYIINNFENMTISSMNAILKFLEEPNQKITAILCTDNIDRVLPTIVSRCKLIPFKAIGSKEVEENAVKEGLSALDAHLLAGYLDEEKLLKKTSESDAYQSALTIWLEYLSRSFKDRTKGQFYLEAEAFKGYEKDKLRNIFSWFIKIGLVFCMDVLEKNSDYEKRYDQLLEEFSNSGFSAEATMMVLLKGQDDLLAKANTALTIDRFGYLMSKEDRI